MTTMRLTLFLFFCIIGFAAMAQSSGKKKQASTTQPSQGPNSLNPYQPEVNYKEQKKSKKSRHSGPTYSSEQEYYERVEAVAKARRKSEKEMEKPQYSNPMYFGHKKLPKKHSRKKMKFCKECGIRH